VKFLAQVRKLVQKVVTRDSLHYRKLTDKPRVKEEDSKDSDRVKDVTRERVKEKDPAAGEALAALAFGLYHSLLHYACVPCHVAQFIDLHT
jgi:hypothetical protein